MCINFRQIFLLLRKIKIEKTQQVIQRGRWIGKLKKVGHIISIKLVTSNLMQV